MASDRLAVMIEYYEEDVDYMENKNNVILRHTARQLQLIGDALNDKYHHAG